MVLILEDLHWADDATVDLLSAWPAAAPRRASCSSRPIARPRPPSPIIRSARSKQDLLVHRLCHELPLEPLNEAAVADYLSREAAAGPLLVFRIIAPVYFMKDLLEPWNIDGIKYDWSILG